jgi:hypothetical protein
MLLHAIANGFLGMTSLKGEGAEEPSWVKVVEAGPVGAKPPLNLTFRDLIDEVRRRLALKGHPWEW